MSEAYERKLRLIGGVARPEATRWMKMWLDDLDHLTAAEQHMVRAIARPVEAMLGLAGGMVDSEILRVKREA